MNNDRRQKNKCSDEKWSVIDIIKQNPVCVDHALILGYNASVAGGSLVEGLAWLI
jgi:hypothetical protein